MGLMEVKYLCFWWIFKILAKWLWGSVMTDASSYINWRSFVQIFLKLDRDITKIKKNFSRGGRGVSWIGGRGTYLIWWGELAPITYISKVTGEFVMFIEASKHIFRNGGTHLHLLVVGALTYIDRVGGGPSPLMYLLFGAVYWFRHLMSLL